MKKLRFLVGLFIALIPLFSAPAQAEDVRDLLAKGGAGGWLNVERPVTRGDMEGRLVLLDFWTYGCINCMQVIPDLTYLEEKFGDKLLIIGVHSAKFKGEQGNDRILAAAQRFGLKHPVINDSDFAIWSTFNVKAWPTLVLLDGQGQEISRYAGEGHREKLERDISASLSGVTATAALPAIAKTDKENSLLWFPSRLIRANGEGFYLADTGHNRILGFDETGRIHSVIGTGKAGFKDGDYTQAAFNQPRGIEVLGDKILVADTGNHAIREIDIRTHIVTTIVGTGARGFDRKLHDRPALETALASPWDILFIPLSMERKFVVAMAGLHQLFVYDADKETMSVYAGTGAEKIKDGAAATAELAQPSALSMDGNSLYFLDAESSALRVLEDGKVKTLIGTGLFDFGAADGKYPDAMLQHPQGLDARNGQVYVADTYNNAIRLYDRQSGELSTLKLKGGTLNEPGDILLIDDMALIVDTGNHSLRKLDLKSGELTPFELKPMQP